MPQPVASQAEPCSEGARLDQVWAELNFELQGRALQLLVRLALQWVRQPDPNPTPEVSHAIPNGE